MKQQIKIIPGFPEHLRHRAAEIYFEAFEQKIGWLLGGREKAITYIKGVMNPDFVLCAISENSGEQTLVGLAGYKTTKGSFVGGGFSDLADNFGFFSSLWRIPILALLDRDTESGVLLMDGIAVTPDQRGRGTGSKLLDAMATYAKSNGYQSVRLDVIDTNPRAKALYERHGFTTKDTVKLGFLKPLFGFSSSTQMVLQVNK